tara:strand:- start:318 stop:422 length:105 start_codon:yes stop_codon:yes gene_type:complete
MQLLGTKPIEKENEKEDKKPSFERSNSYPMGHHI